MRSLNAQLAATIKGHSSSALKAGWVERRRRRVGVAEWRWDSEVRREGDAGREEEQPARPSHCFVCFSVG